MWKVPRRGRRPHTLPGFPLGKRLSSAIAPRLFTQCLLRTVPLPPSPHLTLPSFFLTRHIPDGWFTCSHLFFFRPPRVSAVPEHRETCLRVHASCRSTERRASACAHLTNGRNVSAIWCQGPRAHTTPGPARKQGHSLYKERFPKKVYQWEKRKDPTEDTVAWAHICRRYTPAAMGTYRFMPGFFFFFFFS